MIEADPFAACAAHALALRAIIRYRVYRGQRFLRGRFDLVGQELPDLAPNLEHGNAAK